MVKVMEAVISNTMEAATNYNVPPTTLKNRISGRIKHRTKPGPQSYLTPEEENKLADFWLMLTRWAIERLNEKLFKE